MLNLFVAECFLLSYLFLDKSLAVRAVLCCVMCCLLCARICYRSVAVLWSHVWPMYCRMCFLHDVLSCLSSYEMSYVCRMCFRMCYRICLQYKCFVVCVVIRAAVCDVVCAVVSASVILFYVHHKRILFGFCLNVFFIASRRPP